MSNNTTTTATTTPHNSGMEALSWVAMVFFLVSAVVGFGVLVLVKRVQQYSLVPLLCIILSMTYMLTGQDDYVYVRTTGNDRLNVLILLLNTFIWWALFNLGFHFLSVPLEYASDLRTLATVGLVFVAVSAFSGHGVRYGSVIAIMLIVGAVALMALKSERIRAWRQAHKSSGAAQALDHHYHSALWLGGLSVLGMLYGLAAVLSHDFVGVLGLSKALFLYFFTHILTVLFLVYTCTYSPPALAAQDVRTNSAAANGDQHATISLANDFDNGELMTPTSALSSAFNA